MDHPALEQWLTTNRDAQEKTRDFELRLLLQSITRRSRSLYNRSRDEDDWISMHYAEESFFELLGYKRIIKFRIARVTATSRGLVEWGEADEEYWGQLITVNARSFDSEEAPGASLRLTKKGLYLVGYDRWCAWKSKQLNLSFSTLVENERNIRLANRLGCELADLRYGLLKNTVGRWSI